MVSLADGFGGGDEASHLVDEPVRVLGAGLDALELPTLGAGRIRRISCAAAVMWSRALRSSRWSACSARRAAGPGYQLADERVRHPADAPRENMQRRDAEPRSGQAPGARDNTQQGTYLEIVKSQPGG